MRNLKIAIVAMMIAIDSAAIASPLEPTSSDGICNSVEAGEARFQIGDRVKLTIYERTDTESVNFNDRGHPTNGLRSYRLRAEVSGEYDVNEGGSVSVPMLGEIVFAGRPLPAVRADISKAFEAALGHVGLITLSVTEHQPIYVLGLVKSPGAYKFVPGMSLLQAIALAGGFERGSIELSQMLETLNEIEKNKKSAESLKRLLARDAVLRAERQGTPVTAPKALIDMSDEAEAAQLLAYERTQRDATKSSDNMQLRSIGGAIESAQQAIESRTQQYAALETLVSTRLKRLSTLRDLKEKGNIAAPSIDAAMSDLADAQSRAQEVKVSIEQARGQLAEARSMLEKQNEQIKTELPRASSETEALIAQETQTYQSSGAGIVTINQRIMDPDVSTEQSKVVYEVIRRTLNGLQKLSADGFCDLQPGDLLRVRVLKVGESALHSPVVSN